jgi:hypothetical protein
MPGIFTLSIPVCVYTIKMTIQVPSSHTNTYVFLQFISGKYYMFRLMSAIIMCMQPQDEIQVIKVNKLEKHIGICM